MAYNSSTEIITPPVSIYDLQQCFATVLRKTVSGETQSLLSADLGVIIGKKRNETIDGWTVYSRRNINKFSRHKPVPYASVRPIGFGYNSSTNEAKSVGHGLSIPDVQTGNPSTLSGKRDIIEDVAANDWEYTVPTGGASQPFRLTDLSEYYHQAVPPVQVVYPNGGWQHIVGSTGNLVIHIDLDPADEQYNLHASDIANLPLGDGTNTLDLRNAKIVMAIWYQSTIYIYETSDTLLDQDYNINVDSIIVPVSDIFSTMTGTFDANVAMCIKQGNIWIPLPKQGNYNPSSMYLKFIDDPKQSGAGIDDAENDVMVSPAQAISFKTLADCADNFGQATYAMRSQGSLYIKMLLTNDTNQSKTVIRQDFTVQAGSDSVLRSPSNMYNTSWSDVSNTGITVPANGTATVILYFDSLFINAFSDFRQWTTVRQETLFFSRNGATLVDFDLNIKYGTDGWVSYP